MHRQPGFLNANGTRQRGETLNAKNAGREKTRFVCKTEKKLIPKWRFPWGVPQEHKDTENRPARGQAWKVGKLE